jgi:hypothetical protein
MSKWEWECVWEIFQGVEEVVIRIGQFIEDHLEERSPGYFGGKGGLDLEREYKESGLGDITQDRPSEDH